MLTSAPITSIAQNVRHAFRLTGQLAELAFQVILPNGGMMVSF
jgi:hypothetical protein